MKPYMHYNFRDVLAAPARAFAAKQILVMTIFLGAAWAVYATSVYLAYAVGGANLSFVWSVYHFFPSPDLQSLGAVSHFVAYAGFLIALWVVMLGMFAVASFNVERIRGNRFFRVADAFTFVRCRMRQLLYAELSLVTFLAFIVLLFALAGLLGRIPYVGEWLYSVFFVFPTFIVAILSVFVLIVLQASLLLMPAVAATERKGETFTVILEAFSTIIRQPFRWIGYTAYSLVAGKFASFVYAYLTYRAVQFMVWGTGLTDGGRMAVLVRDALGLLPVRADVVQSACTIFPGVDFGFSLLSWPPLGYYSLASYVMAFMIFILFTSVVAYFLAAIAGSQAYIYVVLRYNREGYRVDEEEPLNLDAASHESDSADSLS